MIESILFLYGELLGPKLTSSVIIALSVVALIGALLITKIWKAVAVTILRRTANKRRNAPQPWVIP